MIEGNFDQFGSEKGFRNDYYKSELCSAAFRPPNTVTTVFRELFECWTLILVPIIFYNRKKLRALSFGIIERIVKPFLKRTDYFILSAMIDICFEALMNFTNLFLPEFSNSRIVRLSNQILILI